VNNGILLSPTYDALFDQHLITFDNNGKIVLASNLKDSEYKKIGVSGYEHITFKDNNIVYLERHQAVFSSKYKSN
jgi:predicted restriction endonuclease